MRGTRLGYRRYRQLQGIIPANAGNTDYPVQMTDIFEDHPRGCGEHLRKLFGDQYRTGSSPRMRGTLDSQLLVIHSTGIIPADAGNTFSS